MMIHNAHSAASGFSVIHHKPAHILVVIADYYPDISHHLLEGCQYCLQHCAPHASVTKVVVDGALEVAQAVARCHANTSAADSLETSAIDGVVALGCVIKGETSHFEIVSSYSISLLLDKCLQLGLPLGNGILTVDTQQQAHERAQWPVAPSRMVNANKGAAAAHAMLRVLCL